jgi:hypothetical protein
MKIIDISPDNEQQYFCCLEEWSDDIKEAGDHKEKWYRFMKDKGVRVKFAEDDNGIMRLLWKPFTEEAVQPEFIKLKKLPGKGRDKVNITVFRNGWCPVYNLAYERVLRASREFEEEIEIADFQTINREIVEEWGIVDGIYINGKELRTGPPPSYSKIRKKVDKSVRKLKKQEG